MGGGYGSHTLGVETWKDFCLGDYFEIKKGKRLTSDEQTEGSTPYIGAIDSNNGIANYIGQDTIHEGNTISLSYNGSVGEAFYQPKAFWATDDVNVLYFKEKNGITLNKYIALFICAVLRQEKYRYSYGRKWVLESMKSTVIKLPEKSGKPNWSYMEDYMKSLPYGDRIWGGLTAFKKTEKWRQRAIPAAAALTLCKSVRYLQSPSPCFGCYSSCRPTPSDRQLSAPL